MDNNNERKIDNVIPKKGKNLQIIMKIRERRDFELFTSRSNLRLYSIILSLKELSIQSKIGNFFVFRNYRINILVDTLTYTYHLYDKCQM